jgi:hypothetical protein
MDDLINSFRAIKVQQDYDDGDENYRQILDSIEYLEEHLEAKQPVSQSWIDSRIEFIIECRKRFHNFDGVNPNVENREFRTKAYQLEIMMLALHRDALQDKLDLDNYLQFCYHVRWLVEYLMKEFQYMQ